MTRSPDSSSNALMDASIRNVLGPRSLSVNAALVLLLAAASAINGAIAYVYL